MFNVFNKHILHTLCIKHTYRSHVQFMIYYTHVYLLCSLAGPAIDSLNCIVEAMTTERLDDAMKTLNNYAGTDMATSMQKVTPKGENDKWTNWGWVPQTMKDLHCIPEQSLSFGSPWLHRTLSGAHQWGIESIPFTGIGHFVHSTLGRVMVVAWSIEKLLDLAVKPESSMDATSAMNQKTFNKWWTQMMNHAIIDKGETVWVPPGFMTCMITLLDYPVNWTLQIPVMAAPLLKHLSDAVLDKIHSLASDYFKGRTNDKPWNRIMPSFIAWIDSVRDNGKGSQPELAEDDQDLDSAPHEDDGTQPSEPSSAKKQKKN